MKKALVFLAAPAMLLWATVASATPNKSFTAAKGVLPSSIEVVGSSNVKAIRSTTLFQKLFPQLIQQEKDVADGLDKVKRTCGIDAVGSIDDVTVGVEGKDVGLILVALSGVTEQKLTDCIVKIAKNETGETVTTKKSGNVIEFSSSKGNKKLYAAWLPGDVLAFGSDPTDKALLDRMLSGKGALDKSGIGPFLGKLAFDSAFAIAWSKQMPIEKWTMKGGVLDVALAGSTFNGTTTIKLASSKEANEIASTGKQELSRAQSSAPKEIANVLKTILISSSGDEVTVKASATDKDLLALVGTFFGRGMASASSGGSAPAPRK
jgi:hypothetical protein